MPSVVFDVSSLVGALLKQGSVPERALLLARASATICLSTAVEAEIRAVFARPKFARYLTPGRAEPIERVTDCRDAHDDKYLELALAAGAGTIISSDDDLLLLHPWRGIAILTPAAFVARMESVPDIPAPGSGKPG